MKVKKIVLGIMFAILGSGISHAFDSEYNSTTEQVFNNVPSTSATSLASIAVDTTVAMSVGVTAYASSFSWRNFGRNLVVGTTFSAYDNFIASSIINGYVLITGTDTTGAVIVDSITFSASSRGVGNVPFIYISSFSVHFTSVSNINPNTFNLEVGDGVKIGLDSHFNYPPLYILENDIRIASATIDMRYATFTPRANQDGTSDFKVNYRAVPHKHR